MKKIQIIKPLLIFITICLIVGCNRISNIVYCESTYAEDFFTGNIIDDGVVYTPQQYKDKLLSVSITDTNEIKRRTITDSFRVDLIYQGRGGVYGFMVISLTTFHHYEVISLDKGKQEKCEKIKKGNVYKMSIVPYFDRPEDTYAWQFEEHMYIDGKYVVPAYYWGISNIYLTPNFIGLYYMPN